MNDNSPTPSRRRFLLGGAGAAAALAVPASAFSAMPAAASPTASPKQVPRLQRIPDSAVRRTTAGVRSSAARQIAQARAAGNVIVDIAFEYQQRSYWCGPAATRMALSARGVAVTQQQMADELPTTENGTDAITQVTAVLSGYVGWYESKQMPNDPPTQAQRDLLLTDITTDLDQGYALVTNIVAPASNHPPGYPDQTIWHYFTVIGYNPDNHDVLIADPAGFAPTETYWLSFDQLASLIPPKGYSA